MRGIAFNAPYIDAIFKAAQPLTDVCNDFLTPFECSANLGTDFSYFTEDSRIEYALFVSDKTGEEFKTFAESLFPNINADIFIWSFFHELGHHETIDDFDDEDWVKYRNSIACGLSSIDYFQLPIELAATMWAGEYIQAHPEEVAAFYEKVLVALKHFDETLKIS